MLLEIQSQDNGLMEIIKQKALPYYQRGYSAVVEQFEPCLEVHYDP